MSRVLEYSFQFSYGLLGSIWRLVVLEGEYLSFNVSSAGTENNFLTPIRCSTPLSFLSLFVVGVGSTLFHATLLYWAQVRHTKERRDRERKREKRTEREHLPPHVSVKFLFFFFLWFTSLFLISFVSSFPLSFSMNYLCYWVHWFSLIQ